MGKVPICIYIYMESNGHEHLRPPFAAASPKQFPNMVGYFQDRSHWFVVEQTDVQRGCILFACQNL